MKKLKAWRARYLPKLSRPQRIVRNFACIMLAVLCVWFMVEAPALTARWGYRRAERLNFLEEAEISDVVKLESKARIVAAENEEFYVLWYDMPLYENTWLAYAEKESPVTLMMPSSRGWMIELVPWVLFTDLPAARGEVEFTLIPDVSDVYIEEEVHYLVEGELLESGNLLFLIDAYEARYESYEEERQRLAADDVRTTLGYLSMARYGMQYTCQVDIAVRLWDESGNLIYDEILRNGVEVIDNEN